MICLDFSGAIIASIMAQIYSDSTVLSEESIRYSVLSSIRRYRMRFKEQYGEIVICCDGRNYWRKDIFPYYKIKRQKTRDDDKHDWPELFKYINTIKTEL